MVYDIRVRKKTGIRHCNLNLSWCFYDNKADMSTATEAISILQITIYQYKTSYFPRGRRYP